MTDRQFEALKIELFRIWLTNAISFGIIISLLARR